MAKKVFIIILNWNGLNDTLECLQSVFQQAYANFVVVVVDNGSVDDSVVTIAREFPQVVLIRNSRNLGYTGGNNVGMRHAVELGADYVWLLNNDTAVPPDTLTKLVAAAELSPDIGLVSPVVRYYDDPDKIQFQGSYADPADFFLHHVTDPAELDNDFVQRHLLVWGTALLINRAVLDAVGYLAEEYFAYAEDTDYCLRSQNKNFRAKVVLDASVLHKVSRSIGIKSPAQLFLRTRNAYFVWRDNVAGIRRLLVPGYYCATVIAAARQLLEEGNERGFDACLNGFWAALQGRVGAYDATQVIPPGVKTVLRFFVSWHPYFWINLLKLNMRGLVVTARQRIGLA